MITEQDVLRVRMEAAQLEKQAAQVRLETAKDEQASARKTFEMADLVRRSMMRREGVGA